MGAVAVDVCPLGTLLESSSGCVYFELPLPIASVFPAVPGAAPLSCILERASLVILGRVCAPPGSPRCVCWSVGSTHQGLVGGGHAVVQFRKPCSKLHPDQPPVLTPGQPPQSSLLGGLPAPCGGSWRGLPACKRPASGLWGCACGWELGKAAAGPPQLSASASAGLPAGLPELAVWGEGRPLTGEGRAWEDRRSMLVLLRGCVILLEAIKETDVQVFFFRKQIMALRPIGRKFEQVS